MVSISYHATLSAGAGLPSMTGEHLNLKSTSLSYLKAMISFCRIKESHHVGAGGDHGSQVLTGPHEAEQKWPLTPALGPEPRSWLLGQSVFALDQYLCMHACVRMHV